MHTVTTILESQFEHLWHKPTSEQRPPANNGHKFRVPSVVVVHKFDSKCKMSINMFYGIFYCKKSQQSVFLTVQEMMHGEQVEQYFFISKSKIYIFYIFRGKKEQNYFIAAFFPFFGSLQNSFLIWKQMNCFTIKYTTNSISKIRNLPLTTQSHKLFI
jgi:hypothetical protein